MVVVFYAGYAFAIHKKILPLWKAYFFLQAAYQLYLVVCVFLILFRLWHLYPFLTIQSAIFNAVSLYLLNELGTQHSHKRGLFVL